MSIRFKRCGATGEGDIWWHGDGGIGDGRVSGPTVERVRAEGTWRHVKRCGNDEGASAAAQGQRGVPYGVGLALKPCALIPALLNRYPDVIESCPPPGSGQKHSHTIKSHHNVGGLPKDLQFTLIEPFRDLFKDEVCLWLRRAKRHMVHPCGCHH